MDNHTISKNIDRLQKQLIEEDKSNGNAMLKVKNCNAIKSQLSFLYDIIGELTIEEFLKGE